MASSNTLKIRYIDFKEVTIKIKGVPTKKQVPIHLISKVVCTDETRIGSFKQ